MQSFRNLFSGVFLWAAKSKSEIKKFGFPIQDDEFWIHRLEFGKFEKLLRKIWEKTPENEFAKKKILVWI